eukprot:212028_1
MPFPPRKAVHRFPLWRSTKSSTNEASSDIRNCIGAGEDVASCGKRKRLGVGFLCPHCCHCPNPSSTCDTTGHSPSVPHAVLLHPKQQLAIIGDVHGCVNELEELLEKIYQNSTNTTVVLVGDLVNKGPKSAETIQLVRSKGLYCVRGNHDQHVLDARNRCGRFEGVKALPEALSWIDDRLDEADVSFLSELPYTISIPLFNAIVVHAGIVPGLSLSLQSHQAMISMRNLLPLQTGTGFSEWIASSNCDAGCPWVDEWKGPGRIFFGHDAKRGLQKTRYAIGLDTGCCYGNKLTAILLPNEEFVSVDAKETYEVPGSNKYGNGEQQHSAADQK